MSPLAALLIVLLVQVVPAVVRAGTPVDAKLETHVQSAISNAGDSVTAIVTQPIRAGRDIIVPEGSQLIGRVETIEPAGRTTAGRVRLVFREVQLVDGRRISTWITNSFAAGPPKRNFRYFLYMGIGGAAGALVGGHSARIAGLLGGTLAGFVIAGNTDSGKFPEIALKAGQVVRLQLGEDLKLNE